MGCTNSVGLAEEKLQKVKFEIALKSSIVIQKWFRRYQARLETRRRCTWKIFETIEYHEEQDQQNLYNFFNEMVDKVNSDGLVSKFREVLLDSNSNQFENDQENIIIMEDVEKTEITAGYDGPHVELPLTLETVQDILSYFKRRKKNPDHLAWAANIEKLMKLNTILKTLTRCMHHGLILRAMSSQKINSLILHAKYVKLLLWEATKKIKHFPNVLSADLNISKQITICGDIHGKLDDLLTVFHKNGLPSSDNPYIFNGDFVDRGQRSIEVLITLCCFFLLYPNEVYLNRGNHEDHMMNSRYGFIKEIQNKYKNDACMIKELCKNLFGWLPLATIVGKKLFVAHGGISDKTNLDIIRKLKRYQFASVLKPSHISLTDALPPTLDTVAEWEQVLDLLWSDPQIEPGRIFNHTRGGGCFFGPDVTAKFLEKNDMDLIIRSHECKYEGFEYTHRNKVVTIFSASNYYAEGSNYGAYLKIVSDAKPFPVQYLVSDERRTLTLKQIVGVNEQSALRDLRERFFYHREELVAIFKKYDNNDSGTLKVNDWAYCMENVLRLKLPWTILRDKLVAQDENGNVLYMSCLEGYQFNSAVPQQLTSISEVLYRNRSSLETVFRLIDKDCSGFITLDEFRHSCEVLNQLSPNQIPPNKVNDLASSLDINQDGKIDFNEFLEAFRLVSLTVEEMDGT